MGSMPLIPGSPHKVLNIANLQKLKTLNEAKDMKEKKLTMPLILSCLGAILILINGAIVVYNGAPIIISSGSLENVTSSGAPFWWRLSFGVRGIVASGLAPVWLVFAIISLLGTIMFYFKPLKHRILGSVIILFSVLSIPIGGGFIIGLILAVIGGGMIFEWPKPSWETFFGRLARAARLDSKLYSAVSEDPKTLRTAAYTLFLVNILSGLGIGIYSLNVRKILNPTFPAGRSTDILMLGDLILDFSALSLPFTFLGISIIKWIILTGIMYIIGTKVIGSKTEFEKIGRAVAFAYVPISLQFFMPFLFTSKPFLTTWPLILLTVTNLWLIIALVLAVKQSLEISLGKSFGTVLLGGTMYWLINYALFVKAFQTPGISSATSIPIFPIPMVTYSIQFSIQPPELVFMVVSIFLVLAMLMGIFQRR